MTKPRKLEFFAWYEFDYTADTSHLSREEDYAYWRIIREIFRTAQDTCKIRDNDDYLRAVARASEAEWIGIRRALIDGAKPLLKKHRGGWISQQRLTKEIRTAQEKSSKARAAVDERERIKRSSDDHRTMIGRSSSERESKKKTLGERENSTTTAGARGANDATKNMLRADAALILNDPVLQAMRIEDPEAYEAAVLRRKQWSANEYAAVLGNDELRAYRKPRSVSA